MLSQPPADAGPSVMQSIKRPSMKATALWTLRAASAMALAMGLCQAAQAQDKAADEPAPAASAPQQEEQINFEADGLTYDSNSQIVTASGNVFIRRDGQLVRADKVVWNRQSGEVVATGNVRITDRNGNVLYGDNIQLTDSLRDGAIDNILVVLAEGGRLVAAKGTRSDGVITLDQAAYSPCPIEDSEGCARDPSWQIKAVQVIYDPVQERMRYKGARLELFGLPLIPLPGLTHAVGAGRSSGLLVPDVSFSAVNGVEIHQPYYVSIAPNRDLVATAHVFTEALPMVSAKYRALTEDGAYQVTGYATASSRIPVSTPSTVRQDDFRGYIDANGRFQLSPKWTVTGSLRVATDRTFLRRYDISRDDRLRSNFAIERITRHSYFSLSGWATQTLRSNDDQGQVPIALPIIDFRARLPNRVLGGQLEMQVNTMAVGRTDGQDTQRAFALTKWEYQGLTGLGQQFTLTALARGDVYHSDDNLLTSNLIYRGNPGWETRASATAALDVKWPFAGQIFGGTQVLTPRFQVVATPQTRNIEIPNEDSRAIDLEDSNLFALNRFAGYDRIEDGARFTYGLEWQFTRPNLAVNTIIGQSYRLTSEPVIFPDGTGLTNRTSDIVGRTQVRFGDLVRFTHRYRLDKDSLAIRRNEIDAMLGNRRTYAEAGYLRLNRDIGSGFEDLRDREELRVGGRIQIDDNWSIFGSGVFDLTSTREDPSSTSDGFEPLRTRLGIAYSDDCIEIGVTWRRDYVDNGDAERGNTFLFRIALRNLGF